MKDTPPEIEDRYRELLMQRSGVERLHMGADMFDTARELAIAGLRAEGVEDLRAALFLRFYGDEFEPQERARIVERLLTYDAEQ